MAWSKDRHSSDGAASAGQALNAWSDYNKFKISNPDLLNGYQNNHLEGAVFENEAGDPINLLAPGAGKNEVFFYMSTQAVKNAQSKNENIYASVPTAYQDGSARVSFETPDARIFFRKISGTYDQSDAELGKLESTSFFKTIDLVSEGPIAGFCDYTGKLVSGKHILKGIYLDDIPVMTTDKFGNDGQLNFRNIAVAYKNGASGQSGFYTGQTDDFYWMEDFSYTSKTINKGIPLYNAKSLGSALTANKFYQGSHTIIDEDVDWLCLTVGVDQCFRISEEDGENLPNAGNVHIWGDFTGVVHRSLPERTIQQIADEGKSAGFENNHNLFVNFAGLATSPYREDIFLKLKDVKDINGKRPRNVYIQNLTAEQENFKVKFSCGLSSVTEITRKNLSYPSSAYVGIVMDAENNPSIPTRTFDLKLKKVKVPSNYEDMGEGFDGPVREDRHPGVWNGTFKSELEWTDNPAWILYDLITNDRYGLGEYIKETEIDKFQLYKIAKYCDKLVNTSKKGDLSDFVKERRYTCNLILENAQDAYKTINEISSVFRGIAFYNANQIFISENSLKESILTFNNSTVLSGGFSYAGVSKDARFTAVRVAYKDKDDGYLPKYEYIEDPEGILRFGLKEKEVSAVGCTSRDQALRLGRWILATSNFEEETVSFKTDSQVEYIQPGDVFTVRDEIRAGVRTGGRIKHIVNEKTNVSEILYC